MGTKAETSADYVGIERAAWAEESLKHDVFWANAYAMDDQWQVPQSCSEWAGLNWNQSDSHECFLVRDKLNMYWECTKDLPEKELKDHTSVSIHEDTPPAVAKRVRGAIYRYRDVFDKGLGGLPLAVAGGKVHIKLKPNATPVRCPEPKWGHGPKRKILEQWARGKLASGEFIPATDCEWGSRPTIAM